ncbi:MAG: O-antigen ligase family protein [Nannocystaceae bacterium]
MPQDSRSGSSRARGDRLDRALLLIAIAGPPLAIGGVWPWLVPALLVVVAALWHRTTRARGPIVAPYFGLAALVAAALAALQWTPLPPALRAAIAPEVAARVDLATAGVGEFWGSLSPVPGDTGLAAARLVALALLLIAAGRLPWRRAARAVAATGAAVALVGLVQAAFGVDAIYGLYYPRDTSPADSAALLTTFVNANHQSGLLLLGIFAAAAVRLDARERARRSVDASESDALRDRGLMALGALLLQLTALVLSLSRAALVAAALTTPLALWIAWRRTDRRRLTRRAIAGRLLAVVAIAALVAALARPQAWKELATLGALGEGPQDKLRVVVDALALLWWSPVFGLGDGAFLDLFPAVDTAPGVLVHTHVESTPVAWLIAFGIPVGGALLVTAALLWITSYRGSSARPSSRARRLALCGLLALAIQSLADFSLSFLGVAAPAAALAGGLARGGVSLPRAPTRRAGLALLGLALALACWSAPRSWSERAAVHDRMSEGAGTFEQVIAYAPLDAWTHRALARAAAERGDWATAEARARVLATLAPASIDGHLLLAAAARADGREADAERHLARALARVHSPPPPAFIDDLLAWRPRAEALAPLLPASLERFRWIVEAIGERDPQLALELSTRARPADFDALELQVSLALAADDPALALHTARLLRAQDPTRLEGHLLVVRALRSCRPPREAEARAALEEALAGPITDPAALGVLEEALARALLATRAPEDRDRARALVERLRERPADRDAARRRAALRQELAAGAR